MCFLSVYVCNSTAFRSLQAFNVLSAVVKQRHEPGVKLECKVLEVRDVDVSKMQSKVGV